MTVHVLVTFRRAELLRASTLVFDSIRTAFPTARIEVHQNLAEDAEPNLDWRPIYDAFARARVDKVHPPVSTIHHIWILDLLDQATEQFWICDTDVHFFSRVEDWDFEDAPLAGRYVPQFLCKFAKAVSRPRFHTSLLRFNPKQIEERVRFYFSTLQNSPFTPKPNLIYPQYYPMGHGLGVRTFFNDTTSLLYQVVGGTAFTPMQLDAYFHLNSGSISDLVEPSYPGLRVQHFSAMDNPELLRGSWRKDDEFYRRNAA